MIRDLRYAIRALTRSPLFAVSAVVTLAIGIAVNTIVFTLLNSLALRPMPVRDADRLVRVYPVDSRGHRENLFSYLDYLEYKASPALDGATAYIPSSVSVSKSTAAAALSTTASQLATAFPAGDRPSTVVVASGTFFTLDAGIWPVIVLVLSMVAVVLAIACANVGRLVVARTSSRQKEIAVRLAIGAKPGGSFAI